MRTVILSLLIRLEVRTLISRVVSEADRPVVLIFILWRSLALIILILAIIDWNSTINLWFRNFTILKLSSLVIVGGTVLVDAIIRIIFGWLLENKVVHFIYFLPVALVTSQSCSKKRFDLKFNPLSLIITFFSYSDNFLGFETFDIFLNGA